MHLMINEGNFKRYPDFTALSLVGTSEELRALATALMMKANYPDTFVHTHTGIEGVLLEIGHIKNKEN